MKAKPYQEKKPWLIKSGLMTINSSASERCRLDFCPRIEASVVYSTEAFLLGGIKPASRLVSNLPSLSKPSFCIDSLFSHSNYSRYTYLIGFRVILIKTFKFDPRCKFMQSSTKEPYIAMWLFGSLNF